MFDYYQDVVLAKEGVKVGEYWTRVVRVAASFRRASSRFVELTSRSRFGSVLGFWFGAG